MIIASNTITGTSWLELAMWIERVARCIRVHMLLRWLPSRRVGESLITTIAAVVRGLVLRWCLVLAQKVDGVYAYFGVLGIYLLRVLLMIRGII